MSSGIGERRGSTERDVSDKTSLAEEQASGPYFFLQGKIW